MSNKSLIAIFKDFKSEEPNELSVTAGSIVQFVNKIDRIWYEVYQDGVTALVPISVCRELNYTDLEALKLIESVQSVFVAKFDFVHNCQDGDLRFAHSEILIGFNMIDDQWWYGTRLTSVKKKQNSFFVEKSNCGMFPLNYVWKLKEELLPEFVFVEDGIQILNDDVPQESFSPVVAIQPVEVVGSDSSQTHVMNEDVKFYVKVIQTMDAQLENEIDLPLIGEILAVIQVPDRMFYYGMSLDNKRKGIFPKKFVIIDNDFNPQNMNSPAPTNSLNCSNNSDSSISVSPAPPIISPPPSPPPYLRGQSVDEISDFPPSYEKALEYERVTNGYSNVMLKEVKPYGQVLFDFNAEDSGDLALKKNEIVYLIRHVDNNWMEGEINGQSGYFPKNYISIIVDCEPTPSQSTESNDEQSSTTDQNTAVEFPPNSYARILYTYNGDYKEDLEVSAGEVVTLLRYFNSTEWMEARNSSGKVGFLHANLCEPINCTLPFYTSTSNGTNRYANLDDNSLLDEKEKLQEQLKLEEQEPSTSRTIDQYPKLQRLDSKPYRPAPPAPRSQNMFPTFNQFLFEEKSELYQFDSEPSRDSIEESRESTETAGFSNTEKNPLNQLTLNQSKRQCVITELMQTERDYCDVMSICVRTFEADNQEAKKHNVDIDKLFGDIKAVITVSKHLIKSLDNYAYSKPYDEQRVGICFLDLKFEIKEAYTKYCKNHDNVNVQLKFYEENPKSSDFMQKCLHKIQTQTNCFDLSSILIKPVQRILKYPLLLNELIKYTEERHVDLDGLQAGLQVITHIATNINEHKRRQDLIQKYCKIDRTLSNRLKNLNMHSVMKKSSRIGYRLLTTLTFSSGTKDKTYDDVLQKFHSVDKTIKTFIKNAKNYLENLSQYYIQLLVIIEAVGEYYDDKHTNNRDVESTRLAHRKISTEYFTQFKNCIEDDVIKVLQTLQNKFTAPLKLISKREDKRIDYEKSLRSNKDTTETKNNFEALNQQLIDDLPLLTDSSMQIIQNCIHTFLLEYRKLIYRTRDTVFGLKSLPAIQNSMFEYPQDIEECYRVKHNLIFEKMLSDFSLIHANLFSEVNFSNDGGSSISTLARFNRNKNTWRNSLPVNKTIATMNNSINNVDNTKLQNDSHKSQLKSRYPQQALHEVVYDYEPCDVLELTARKGDLVGVIKQKDPMGQEHRWFVDRGCEKGFLPRNILVPCHHQQNSTPQTIQELIIQPQIISNQAHVYDMVPDDDGSDKHSSLLSFDEFDNQDKNSLLDTLSEFDPFRPITPDKGRTDEQSRASSAASSESSNSKSSIECYFAAYPFKADGQYQLSLDFGQMVSVLHKCDTSGNSEWWSVKNSSGQIGYVPANYLRKG